MIEGIVGEMVDGVIALTQRGQVDQQTKKISVNNGSREHENISKVAQIQFLQTKKKQHTKIPKLKIKKMKISNYNCMDILYFLKKIK